MKIAVFGATGGTGKQVVQQALAAGDQVTALVRDPAKLAIENANLTVVTGNVLDAAKVEETLCKVPMRSSSRWATPATTRITSFRRARR